MGQSPGVPHQNRVMHPKAKVDWYPARADTIRASIRALEFRIAYGYLEPGEKEKEFERLATLKALLKRAEL